MLILNHAFNFHRDSMERKMMTFINNILRQWWSEDFRKRSMGEREARVKKKWGLQQKKGKRETCCARKLFSIAQQSFKNKLTITSSPRIVVYTEINNKTYDIRKWVKSEKHKSIDYYLLSLNILIHYLIARH